jgi:hypothetical protein
MVGVIISDGEEDARIQRPQRKSKPTAALLEHSEAAALPSQQRRVEEFCAAEAARRAAEIRSAIAQIRVQPPTDSSESPRATPSAGPSVPTSPSPSLYTSDAPTFIIWRLGYPAPTDVAKRGGSDFSRPFRRFREGREFSSKLDIFVAGRISVGWMSETR